jgi:hypothetical protein
MKLPCCQNVWMQVVSLVSGIILILGIGGCEESFVPDTIQTEQEIVVEGYIEAGEQRNPTFVLLTKSIPFFSTISVEQFSSLFVRGAKVTVSDGVKEVVLQELCLNQLPEDLKKEVYKVLGFNPDSAAVDLCVYADIFEQIKPEFGREYKLRVESEGKVLNASTTIPDSVGLRKFRFMEPPGAPRDSLAQLMVTISDPQGQRNYYRYFTSTSRQPGLIAPFNSVTDDAIFDGKEFEFPLQRAQRRGSGFNPDAFGLFYRGDTISIKWCTIDQAHFDFWNTRDFSANSGGPFASYTRIATNIEGGLGIWGGYAVARYNLIVPEK